MKKLGIIIFSVGSIITLAWGGFSVYIGAKDNNNGEFYDFQTGVWDVPYALIWLLYPFVTWIIIFFAGYGIYRLYKHGEKMAMK